MRGIPRDSSKRPAPPREVAGGVMVSCMEKARMRGTIGGQGPLSGKKGFAGQGEGYQGRSDCKTPNLNKKDKLEQAEGNNGVGKFIPGGIK